MSIQKCGPCPYLPENDPTLSAVSMRRVGSDRGEAFFLLALQCAQALWMKGLPAQSLLLMNRAFSADLNGDESILIDYPLPYRAMRWVMEARRADQFIGNPRRHFKHLATRMSGPRRELRSWRAWGCWAIAREVFPTDPADLKQLEEEGMVEPEREEIRCRLADLGHPGEAKEWEGCLRFSVFE